MQVPLLLHKQGIPGMVLGILRFNKMQSEHIPRWQDLADKAPATHLAPTKLNNSRQVNTATQVVNIGIVGKYTGLSDSYLSVTKVILHSTRADIC